MKMVCFCEKAHFRFLYTPSLFMAKQKLAGGGRKIKTLYYLCLIIQRIKQ